MKLTFNINTIKETIVVDVSFRTGKPLIENVIPKFQQLSAPWRSTLFRKENKSNVILYVSPKV
jgi:hypothetical protein